MKLIKNLIIYIILLVYTPLFCGYTDDFKKANDLYSKEKFSEALPVYKALAIKNKTEWRIFYNLGNCLYKSGNFLDAKIYYMRALKLSPSEECIKKNLKIVNKKFALNKKSRDDNFIKNIISETESLFSVNILAVLLILIILILNTGLFLLVKKGRNKIFLYTVFFSFIALCFFSVYTVYRINKSENRLQAVVIKENVSLKSGPGEGNTTLYQVNRGLDLKIIGTNGEWLQVFSEEIQDTGWIKAEYIEKI